jgi:hypothetical protein
MSSRAPITAKNHEGVDIDGHVTLILHRSRERSRCACSSLRVANRAAANNFSVMRKSLTKINLLVVEPSARLALRDYFHARLMSVSDNCKLQMTGSAAQHRKAIPQKPAGPRRANSQPDTMVNNAVPPIPTVP